MRDIFGVQGGTMDPFQELIEQGKQFFENRDYGKAEGYFRQALRTGGRFADIHHMLGVIYHAEGKFESAIQSFREALKINPNYTEAVLNLAVLYNDLGKYEEAKKLYAGLSKKSKSSENEIEPVLKGKISNMHADLGDIYHTAGCFEMAAGEYQKALQLSPGFSDIRTKLGIVLRESANMERSVQELKTAIKDRPNYLFAKIQLGISYYSGGKIKEAKKEWEGVLKENPDNESAKTYLKLCEK